MTYKLYKTLPVKAEADAVMKINEDGSITSFIFDPANTDFLEYQKWLALGNQPLPPDEPTLSETV